MERLKYINIYSPYNRLSYGIVSRNIIKHLSKVCNVIHFPIGNIEDYEDESVYYLNNKFRSNSTTIKIWHEFDLIPSIGNGKKIGFPIFEKNRFDKNELYQLSGCDHIFVCSHWAKRVLSEFNIKSTVVPLGVDEDFNFIQPAFNDKVIFYNQGKREDRKGHNYLHKVFAKAFQNVEDVELWMFSQNPFDSDSEKSNFQLSYKKTLGSKVKFFPFMNKSEMIKWISKTHIGFFPTRAEGFCLPILEGMKMGKHILATNYSGQTEYLPENQSFSCNSFVKAVDNKWFNGNFEWANVESSEEEIVEKLRLLYKKVKEGCVYNAYNTQVASKFSWNNTVNNIVSFLES